MRTFVLIAVTSLLLGAWLALWLRRLADSSAGRARQARGERGEREAERVLEAHGYHVRERKVPVHYEMQVDGVATRVRLILDLIAERDGRSYVVEVKTGAAASLSAHATRRQLLEYQLATDARDVLLVDADAGSVTHVAFPTALGAPRASRAWPLAAAACVAAFAAWWLRAH